MKKPKIDELFHKCWGEAHDSPNYDKQHWLELQALLRLSALSEKFEYWTMWGTSICSRHGTFKAAQRAARACERQGGNIHRIVEVRYVKETHG